MNAVCVLGSKGGGAIPLDTACYYLQIRHYFSQETDTSIKIVKYSSCQAQPTCTAFYSLSSPLLLHHVRATTRFMAGLLGHNVMMGYVFTSQIAESSLRIGEQGAKRGLGEVSRSLQL